MSVLSPTLSRIEIFPIKSLDGVCLSRSPVLKSGALQGDRQWAMVNPQGRFVNGKSTPLVHRIRAIFSPDLQTVELSQLDRTTCHSFDLYHERPALEQWLSDVLGQEITLQDNLELGFPDDTRSPGPTIISTATLTTLQVAFPDLSLAELRRRFRTNLEISNVPAFWEDQLYGRRDDGVPFRIGSVQLLGVNPCQRCIVPTRDSLEGIATPGFQQQFTAFREAHLPDCVPRDRFNHFYKLAVNTRPAAPLPFEALLQVGDAVQVEG